MSVSGCPPSIGARRLGGQCPDCPGETLAKSLQRVLDGFLERAAGECVEANISASVLQAFLMCSQDCAKVATLASRIHS